MNLQYDETLKEKNEENKQIIDEIDQMSIKNSNLEKKIEEIQDKLD